MNAKKTKRPFPRIQTHLGKEPGAKQSFKDECDINNIMAKYQKTGAIEHGNRHGRKYGFATSRDFTESMQIVASANSLFAGLPSTIREKFENDPAKFLEFAQDEENLDEMRKMGLAEQSLPPNAPSADTLSTELLTASKSIETPPSECEKGEKNA